MTALKPETRRFPRCCTSAFCAGFGDDCKDCRNKPILDAFKTWRDEHAAVVADPVWSPSAWTATR